MGVGLHGTAAQPHSRCSGPPWNGRELVVFPRHLLSNVLSGRAMLAPRLQVPPRNKRLCVLQRWPRGGGGPAQELGERETNLSFTVSLRVLEPAPPQNTCHFWPLKGLKASWSQKQAGVPPCQIRRLNCFQLFFFPLLQQVCDQPRDRGASSLPVTGIRLARSHAGGAQDINPGSGPCCSSLPRRLRRGGFFAETFLFSEAAQPSRLY